MGYVNECPACGSPDRKERRYNGKAVHPGSENGLCLSAWHDETPLVTDHPFKPKLPVLCATCGKRAKEHSHADYEDWQSRAEEAETRTIKILSDYGDRLAEIIKLRERTDKAEEKTAAFDRLAAEQCKVTKHVYDLLDSRTEALDAIVTLIGQRYGGGGIHDEVKAIYRRALVNSEKEQTIMTPEPSIWPLPISPSVQEAHELSQQGWIPVQAKAAVADALRAAEERRDTVWRAALKKAHYDYIDGFHTENCADCAPLQALLGSKEEEPLIETEPQSDRDTSFRT